MVHSIILFQYLRSPEFWREYSVSQAQAVCDKQYLYGMLLSSNSNPQHKILLQCADSKDGIRAWATFKAECAYDGSAELRLEQLEVLIGRPYDLDSLDGLSGYIDRFQSYMSEIEILAKADYSDSRKKRLLLKNLRDEQALLHLVQPCHDDKTRSYDATATYLRQNAALYDHASSLAPPSKVMNTKQEPPPTQVMNTTSKPPMDLATASKLFMTVADEQGPFRAFRTFQSQTVRESLSIPYPIWQQLEPIIRDKIVEIRKGIQAKNRSEPQAPTPAPAPGAPAAIPAQYPKMANMAASQDVALNLCNTMAGLNFSDDGNDTDDEEFVIFNANTITVRAHLEYADAPWLTEEQIVGISDCGADSTVLGKGGKVLFHTGRFASLVGYDPSSTRSEKVPIVSGLVKVRSKTEAGIPVLLQLNEAPYLAHSPITLILSLIHI